jgi:bifunctional DNA-binding transcriptional regulator/antitoxin component of YhaV-PrlF toxin-antitoxin module
MTMTPRIYESTVEYNDDYDEYNITIPEELLDSTGWEEGDVLSWILNKDGTVLLTRNEEFGDSADDE